MAAVAAAVAIGASSFIVMVGSFRPASRRRVGLVKAAICGLANSWGPVTRSVSATAVQMAKDLTFFDKPDSDRIRGSDCPPLKLCVACEQLCCRAAFLVPTHLAVTG
jgi:hypothetical protein